MKLREFREKRDYTMKPKKNPLEDSRSGVLKRDPTNF